METVKTTPYADRGFWTVILGGSSGMGLASAHQLAAAGMNICLVFRERRAKLRELESEIQIMRNAGVQVLTFNLDATRQESVDQIIKALQDAISVGESVRLLLHSVARGNLKPMFAKTNETVLTNQDLELTVNAMALSWYRWVISFAENRLFAEDARTLAFTSEGSKMAWRSYGAVAAAKATLEALARNIAVEFAPIGLRCNVVQPGVTDTPSLRMIPGNEELINKSKRRNPYQRLTTPEDVARVVDLLCRDEAAWINGAVIPVDGGECISG